MIRQVALLLGGNRGEVERTFEGVCTELEQRVGQIQSKSECLRSEAWGFSSERFSNQAVVVATELEAEELLDTVQLIEEHWGRDREAEREEKVVSGARYTARTIDIDIIFYGDQVIDTPRLRVPHPLMSEREFVLEPLSQIAPHWCHPILGESVEQMLKKRKKNE